MMYREYWVGPMGLGGGVLFWIFSAVIGAMIITALVHDAQARRWLWLVANVVFPPIAVVRGLLIWLDKI